jgi:hypothetical protein
MELVTAAMNLITSRAFYYLVNFERAERERRKIFAVSLVSFHVT